MIKEFTLIHKFPLLGTAAQARAVGIDLPAHIPDHAIYTEQGFKVMKTIYGFWNEKEILYSDGMAIAIDEDGVVVKTHICSGEGYARHDLHKKDIFDEKYPDGWTFVYVSPQDRDRHAGLQKALAKHRTTQAPPRQTWSDDVCAHCGSSPEDGTRCVYCGTPPYDGVRLIKTHREKEEYLRKELLRILQEDELPRKLLKDCLAYWMSGAHPKDNREFVDEVRKALR